MDDNLIDVGGLHVLADALEVPRARSLAHAVAGGGLAYVRLVECRRLPGDGGPKEAVVLEVDVERPQHHVNPIDRVERIACVFSADDQSYPEALALRADFPRLPHLNLRDVEVPRSLCLYDQAWAEVMTRWTPASFVERIRFWLAESSAGILHRDDQPLEPLLFGCGLQIILPGDLFDAGHGSEAERLDIQGVSFDDGRGVLVAVRPDKEKAKETKFEAVALRLVAEPQQHGVISRSPTNLFELAELARHGGIDLIDLLRLAVVEWNRPELLSRKVVLIIGFPLTRDGGSVVEAQNTWVFQTLSTVRDVGLDLGVWEEVGRQLGQLIRPNPDKVGKEVRVFVLSPVFDLTREMAAAANGASPDGRKVVAVGAGALGGQVISTSARSGFGRWTVIDEDYLLPHNLARHALDRLSVGQPKALSTAFHVSHLYWDQEDAAWIMADVLRPGPHAESLSKAMAEADLILDMAASVPVSRHLARDVASGARRMSAFLNPSGTDLVLLAEGDGRGVALDCVEMQYYRAVAQDDRYASHLAPPPGRTRYARSCRDVSFTIPNHLVSLHAAIAAGAVRAAAAENRPSIRIWQADPKTLDVSHRAVEVTGVSSHTLDGWTLVLDHHVLQQMASARRAKLPKETGGVLIGAFDLPRKVIYLVTTLPSPPDSEEWPTLYIRGSRGLARQVDEIVRRTDGQLEYVGEWHSHPDGYSVHPSGDDCEVFSWLADRMGLAGLPSLMAIAGEGNVTAWFLGQMSHERGLEVTE